MDNNNSFLSNYNKDIGPPEEAVISNPSLGYKYEEKSDFKKPDDKGGGYMPPSRKLPKFLIPSIIGAVVLIVIVIALVLILGGGVKVIDFKGWSLSDAQLWASENGIMLKTNNQYNDSYDNGKVISQDVKPGDTISKGAFITLDISLGHDLTVTLPLPDIMSMTMDEVQKWADQNFMTKVRITTENSDTVPSGKVIRYEINDNTVVSEVRRDTPIYVIVSKGPEDASSIQITVPDFKTMSISESYIFANENGLTLTVTEQYDDYVPAGTVISQSVKANDKVSKGSEIKLVVSKGKEIKIPDFSIYTKDEASSVATTLGIPITVVEKYSSRKAGAFISQSIDPDTIYETGQYLEVDYSLGNTVAITSYVGQTRDAIESWASGLNQQGASITIKVTTTESDSPKGAIIYQDIANKMISVKSTINITVSSGKIIYVPDFVDDSTAPSRGYDTAVTREEAIKMCEDAGIVPVFVKSSCAGRLPDEVWYQSLTPGTEVSQGTTITLKYVPSTTYQVDDFTGKTKTDIESGGYGMKFTITYEAYSEYIAGKEGVVVKQSVAPSTTVAAGAAIILYIGPDSP